MIWKRIKIGIIILLGLLIIVPSILYMNAIDLSQKHRARVSALPLFNPNAQRGEFRLAANKLEFLVRVAGMQNDGPAMILLHGFPESSIMWQPLLDSAAAKGFRVLAFDQRGYSPHARPSGVEAYHIDFLVEDVLAVADQVGFETFHLVGHDWGAGVGWKTTMDFPERVITWTALSIAHIGVFFEAVLNHPEQQKRSAYMKRLQTPFLPEFLFQINRKSFLKRVANVWTPEQIAEYEAILSEHGALSGGLNWYRAVDIEKVIADKTFEKNIIRPTLFIWGSKDQVIAPEIIRKQEAYIIDVPYKALKLEVGHSLMQEAPDRVMEAIFSHIHEEINQ